MVTMDEVIGNFLLRAQLGSSDSYARAYNFAVRGFKDLMIDLGGNIKTVELPILSNKTAQLPEDYLNYIRVGVVNNLGELATFTRNDQLTFHEECCDDRLSQPTLDTRPEFWWDGYAQGNNIWYYGSGYWNRSYGIGSVNKLGDFRIDETSRLILFGFKTRHLDHVILEYISYPTSTDGKYLVHPLLAESLLLYIDWQWIAANRRIPQHERDYARRLYYNEKRLANSRMDPLTVQDLNDSVRAGYKLSPKS